MMSRWFVGVLLVATGIGVLYGVVEGIADYPLASWAPVTLYCGLLGALAGSVLGLAIGSVAVLVRRLR